jgi:hypothetical protein
MTYITFKTVHSLKNIIYLQRSEFYIMTMSLCTFWLVVKVGSASVCGLKQA